ncbi:hypothetical protein OTB20_41015 [Streptomyces sp. H27-H1]|uniref:hypothetical protein n=1 Tax=Streptomyces sp. H27-H1 TaxID=2996461 RepID=UPI0022720557|nr:hypothetical protein [Streptomyces sp. H27-H1]MCY0932420.1 hypothetical protein [Streptomyces sp. H27-H1]
MRASANVPEPAYWDVAQPGYGVPSPGLLARSDQGLARFLGHVDEDSGDSGPEDGAG